jgi:hypothetical protein
MGERQRMKKWMIVLTSVSLIAVACTKDSEQAKDITGKWQWEMSVGGFTGNDTLRPSAGTAVYLWLKNDGTYQRSANDEVTGEGSYAVTEVTSIFTNTTQKAIRFDNNSSNEKLIQWNGNQLILLDNHVEPYGVGYTRVGE